MEAEAAHDPDGESRAARDSAGASRAPTEAIAPVRTSDVVAPVDAGKSGANDTQGWQPAPSDTAETAETSDTAGAAQEPRPGPEQPDVQDEQAALADLPAGLPAHAGGPEQDPQGVVEKKDKAEREAGKQANKEPRSDTKREKKKGKGLGFRKVSLPGADKTETPETGKPADRKTKDKVEHKGLGFRPVEIPDE